MSKILVIQPHKMLQHAFSIALFPEHQVQIMETIPDAATVKDIDLVIVDAVALRQRDSLGARELRDVQSWKIPTIWIDIETNAKAPTRERLVAVHSPPDKDSLQRAMAECLRTADMGKQTAKPISSPATAPASPTATASQQGASAANDAEENFIELVDVVEDDSGRQRPKAPQKKTK
jgi:hypothetical protein